MMKFYAVSALALGLALGLGALPALADGPVPVQPAGQDHSGHSMPTAATGDTSASSKAYQAINDTMHKDMSIVFTGDADIDFVKGMIPHHQGAVDMAKVVLAHGTDPKIRALAEAVVKAQEEEIAFMKAWLKEKGAQ
ncbi:MAG: DUF305 domain-containing protein [Pannonibacter sp.]